MDEAIAIEILNIIALYIPSVTSIGGIVIAIIISIKKISGFIKQIVLEVKALFNKLKTEIDDLNASGELKALRDEIKQLIKDNASLRADNAALLAAFRRISPSGGVIGGKNEHPDKEI